MVELNRVGVIGIILVAIVLVGLAGYYLLLRPATEEEGTTEKAPLEEQPLVTHRDVDVLRVSQRADLSTIDIHAATDAPTLSVLGHVYETLFRVKFDEAGVPTFVPHLVESYTRVNDTVWEFKLRRGIKFHDGTPLTALDVKASFERGPRVGSLPRILLGFLSHVEVVDEHTFRLVLRYPFGPMIAHLSHPSTAIIPAWVVERFPTARIDDTRFIIGTGPYRFVEFRKGERTVLEAFEGYWSDRPTVKRIEWIPIPDDSTRVSFLEAGRVDIITHVPPQYVGLLRDKGFKIVQMPSVRVIYIGINTERITDVRVRQALNYAIDKEHIVKRILEGAGSVATAPIHPAVFGYSRQTPYPYDPARARELIRAAGWEGREIVFITPQGRYLKDNEIADAVRAYLEAAGLRVRVEVMEWGAYITRVTEKRDFDLFLLGWSTVTLDADYGLYSLFRSGAPFNRMFYSNSEVDRLLDSARAETDPARRAQLYAEAQRLIWSDAPWIFLHYEDIIVATKPDLVGFEIQPIERWILTHTMVEVRAGGG